jgi:hypothetical protein
MTKTNQPQLSARLKHQLSNLREGLEAGDLERLVTPKMVIDEYKSKMGNDDEIVVISFHVAGKEPALDIVNFVEKSYEWVADADVSSGEVFDGSYIIFIELERDGEVAEHIIELVEDLRNLTEHSPEDWEVENYKPSRRLSMDLESLKAGIPATPEEYRNSVKSKQTDLDKLKAVAGVNVDTKAPKNDFTEGLRTLAGIR